MPTTFDAALRARLDPRRDPGQPFVTFYDDATGERTELSATTYANWVAKTAGVLVEDLDLVQADRLRVDLPTHWLGPVFLGAAWLAGVEVVTGADAEATVTGPADEAEDAADATGRRLVCALLPFAVRSPVPVPDGAQDFGVLWPGQPDDYLGPRGAAGDAAYDGTDQAALLAGPASGDRVLTDLAPASPDGVALVVATLLGGGSTVWVANPDPERWAARAEAERVTRTVRREPHLR